MYKFKATVKINEKDYMACSSYYLRKYVGIKELILVIALIVGAFVMYFAFNQIIVAILAGITLLLMAGAVLVYLFVSKKNYVEEYKKRNTVTWDFAFHEDGFDITINEQGGEDAYTEKRSYDQVEKVALKKDRVYIYAGAASMYYIKYDSMTEGNFIEFCEFAKSKIDPYKFKMKDKRRKNKQFPYGR
ncbi:MAG: hypothetical protein IJD50_05000 [Clostridia bacterium]|nr:hypothetical protein [Clostridia bacterium]